MDPLRAVVYGIVQGLTEFLPVSSNAHLRLTPLLFGWNEPAETFTAFTAVIQLGTTLAVLLYFAKDLRRVLGGWFASFGKGPKDTPEARLGWGVFYGHDPHRRPRLPAPPPDRVGLPLALRRVRRADPDGPS